VFGGEDEGEFVSVLDEGGAGDDGPLLHGAFAEGERCRAVFGDEFGDGVGGELEA